MRSMFWIYSGLQILLFVVYLVECQEGGSEVYATCSDGQNMGECLPAKLCKKPGKLRFPCPPLPCPKDIHSDSVCCFSKQNKPDNYKKACFPPAVKPGHCPVVKSKGSCAEKCSDDSDCFGERKCCSTGCGHSCQIALNPGAFCRFNDAQLNKQFSGHCSLPQFCTKKVGVACPGLKCQEPYSDNICCFEKGKEPPKLPCQEGPQKNCYMRFEGKQWNGVCRPVEKCKKPGALKFPCVHTSCDEGDVCCFTKQNRPPSEVCQQP